MLTELTIRDFAIISDLNLRFDRGLTVLTGETGAGKSIILDALSLVLGTRADSSQVRHGARRSEISARFAVDQAPAAAQFLTENDLDDEQTVVIRRIVTAEGRSRGYINGSPCPVGQLAELGRHLIEIHGQHEHYQLTQTRRQQSLLDAWVPSRLLTELTQAFGEHQRLERELDALANEGILSDAERDLLEFQALELESVAEDVANLEQLERQHKVLASSQELTETCDDALQTLQESVTPPLSRIMTGIRDALRIDQALDEAHELIESALTQLEESVAALNRYRQDIEAEPARLNDLDERLARIHDLGRKHRQRAAELPQQLADIQSRLQHADTFIDEEKRLRGELAQARKAYAKCASAVHTARVKAANQLSRKVSSGMSELGMSGGKFEINVNFDDDRISAIGGDQVEFRVSANPGQPAKPLANVASGGELSRIGLALRVALTEVSKAATLIFDEIDAGVGGAIAEMIGEKLATLAQSSQIFCVTHLPQVAAFGSQQLKVEKSAAKGKTITQVAQLGDQQRIDEIARMMAGRELTPESRQHAADMLKRSAG